MASLIWFSLVGITAFRPEAGALGLLLGYAFSDRFFALLHVKVAGCPIFITEAVMGLLLVHLWIRSRSQTLSAMAMFRPNSPWFWFFMLGILNVFRGVFLYHPVLVARDSAIVYYALMAFIAASYVHKIEDFYWIFGVMITGLLARMFWSMKGATVLDGLDATTASGMYAAILILGAFCAYSQWLRWRPLIYTVLCILLMAIVSSFIRTLWVSYAAGFVYLAWALRRYRLNAGASLRLLILTAVSVALLCGIFKITEPERLGILKYRIRTFSMGANSPNVMTRVAMWEDSLESVIPGSHKVFAVFDKHVLDPWLGGKMRPAQPVLAKGIVKPGRESAANQLDSFIASAYEKYTPPKPQGEKDMVFQLAQQYQQRAAEMYRVSQKETQLLTDANSSSNSISERKAAFETVEASRAATQAATDVSKIGQEARKVSEVLNKISPEQQHVANQAELMGKEALEAAEEARSASFLAFQAALVASTKSREAARAGALLPKVSPENAGLAHEVNDAAQQASLAAENASKLAVIAAKAATLASHAAQGSKSRLDPHKTSATAVQVARDAHKIAAEAYLAGARAAEATLNAYNAGAKTSGIGYIFLQCNANPAVKFLLGMPFGKLFIPGRISYLHKADRYDPHNSVIAIFYRTGLLGLLLVIIITCSEIRKTFRSIRFASDSRSGELALACTAGLSYYLTHSLFDVTFENPFKGGIFWILIGSLVALRSMDVGYRESKE